MHFFSVTDTAVEMNERFKTNKKTESPLISQQGKKTNLQNYKTT